LHTCDAAARLRRFERQHVEPDADDCEAAHTGGHGFDQDAAQLAPAGVVAPLVH
jgi:hypothetical protein